MIAQTEIRTEEFRKRLRAMSDEKLIQYSRAARYMADPANAADKKTVLAVYRIQLAECRQKWLRRRPKQDGAK
jgi:hypothetical protein